MKTDLRTIKTEQNIKSAFMSLLKKMTFEKINISVLCAEAQIHRVTFYSHYKDKFDLSHEVLSDIITKVVDNSRLSEEDGLSDDEKLVKFCKNLIENTIEECFIYKKSLFEFSTLENSMLAFMLSETIRKSIVESLGQISKLKPIKYNLDLAGSFLCGALTKVVIDWMNNDKGIPKEQFVKSIQAFISDSFRSSVLFI